MSPEPITQVMSADRPSWCPKQTCRCIATVQGIVCGGALPDRVRVCVRGKGNPVILDRLDGDDVEGMRDLLALVDDARIAQLERAG